MSTQPNFQSSQERAYHILKSHGQAMPVIELLRATLGDNPKEAARLYTEISFDARFLSMGRGLWGLSEWHKKRGSILNTEQRDDSDMDDNVSWD